MSTEQQDRTPAPEPGEPVWGAAPQPETRARWSGRKTIAAVAIAVGIAGAGGAAIYAATGNDSGNQGGGPGGMGGPGGPGGFGGRGGGPGGMGGFGRELADALHGEFVVSDGNGGYLTELTQTGKVTAITSTSLTAASADGFTQTYVLDASTVVPSGKLADIAQGDTVSVIARKSGDKATASTLVEGNQQPGMMPRRNGNGAPNGAPPTR